MPASGSKKINGQRSEARNTDLNQSLRSKSTSGTAVLTNRARGRMASCDAAETSRTLLPITWS